jgi:N-acetylmuramoyl-L-alanine amidase
MKVFINPGHDLDHDSGACNADGTRECDIAAAIGKSVKEYLEAAGCECQIMQSDNLDWDSDYADRQDAAVCPTANAWPADIFISIHCNAANTQARGTEVEVYQAGGQSQLLAQCIQDQIVNSLGTIDRGVKEMPQLIVLKRTDMPSALVETAFIDNDEDCSLLKNRTDEFARAIARGVTDYKQA